MLNSLEIKEWMLRTIQNTGGIRFAELLDRLEQEHGQRITSNLGRNYITALCKYKLIRLHKTENRRFDYWVINKPDVTYESMLPRITKQQEMKPEEKDELPPGAVRYKVEDIHELKKKYPAEKKVHKTEVWIGTTFGTMDYGS